MGDLIIAGYVYEKVMSNSSIENKFLAYFIRMFFIIGLITGFIIVGVFIYCTYNADEYNQLAKWQYIVCIIAWLVLSVVYPCFTWWIYKEKRHK